MTELVVLNLVKQAMQAVALDGSHVRTLVGDLYGGSIRKVNLADGTDYELINLGPGITGLALIGTEQR